MLGHDFPLLVMFVFVILSYAFYVWLMRMGYRLVGVQASMSRVSVALAIGGLASLAVRSAYIGLTGYDSGALLIAVGLGLLVNGIALSLFLKCGLLQTIGAFLFMLMVFLTIIVFVSVLVSVLIYGTIPLYDTGNTVGNAGL